MKIINLEEAKDKLVKELPSQDNTQYIPIIDSVGHTIGEEIISKFPIPSFRRSAMDGFAVCTDDLKNSTTKTFRIKDIVMAGDQKLISYEKNTAIRIMTGAPIPTGYNAVVKQEYTKYNNKEVTFLSPIEAGSNIINIGEDTQAGTSLIKSNQTITPASVGVLASLGIDKVKVVEPIKITFLSTGSELISPGSKLEDGKIFNSTIYHFAAFAKKYKFNVVKLENVLDDRAKLQSKFLEASKISDLVVTTGGVSVGDKDYIHEVIKDLDGQLIFKSVAIRPGHPVSASKINNTVFLHTSGSPFAAYANFHMFFWPLIAKYYQNRDYELVKRNRIVGSGYLKPSNFDRVIRVYSDDSLVDLTYNNLSSSITNLVHCNALLLQKKGEEIKKGDKVEVFYLP